MDEIIILSDESEEEAEDVKARIEKIKRDGLKQLNALSPQPTASFSTADTSLTDIFHRGDDAKGFFLSSGDCYIYPTNYPIRDYQRNIVHTCLFHNTLVSLPTGLGKTFIAAVVMYNFYRWYPQGKIIFMAPTRPLVSQQMRACYDIMGIPVEDTIELLGSSSVAVRTKEWNEKRMFYVTPQIIDNDLKNQVFNPEHLKCLVIDEAHKATKNYAYCQVVQQLKDANIKFRLIALSATPGREIADVINLIRKLDIARLELRSENSLDISSYTHTRKIDSIQVPLSDLLLKVREDFLKIVDRYTRSLKQNKVLVGNTGTLTKFTVMLAKDRYVKTKAQFPHINRDLDRILQRDFHITLSLAGALEHLTTYGLRSFYHSLIEMQKENGSCPLLGKDNDLNNLLEELKIKLDIGELSNNYAWSHLKFLRLKELVESHFKCFHDKGENTKIIIFANFRVVVSEIYEMLKPMEPMVKAAMFIGQSSGQKTVGITQHEQKEIMKKFREGTFNTIIATSVAEEGLDIGEVDLVICFEAHKSPIRLVQRIGRTGRKRNGRCVVLLTQGKEASNFQQCMQTCKGYVDKIINNKSVYANLSQNEPRMIPAFMHPTMKCLHIVVKERVTPAKPLKKKKTESKGGDKKSKRKLDTNENESETSKGKKRNVKKLKKETANEKTDIRACFENMSKRKKIEVDFFTQSSGEPVAKEITDENDDVLIVKDEQTQFEHIFNQLESWLDKCSNKDELIIDENLFELLNYFHIDHDEDEEESFENVLDVNSVIKREGMKISNNNNAYESDEMIEYANDGNKHNEHMESKSVPPKVSSKSPDFLQNACLELPNFSQTIPEDVLKHIFSPFENELKASKGFKDVEHIYEDNMDNNEDHMYDEMMSNIEFVSQRSPVRLRKFSQNNHKSLNSQENVSDDLSKNNKLAEDKFNSKIESVHDETCFLSIHENKENQMKHCNKFEKETSNLDDGNDDIFLNVNSLVPTGRDFSISKKDCCPSRSLIIQDLNENNNNTESVPEVEMSVYQSVDDLFMSDNDEESAVIQNNNIRSYFVSESEMKNIEPHVEAMSISDLFDDSSSEKESQNENLVIEKNEYLRISSETTSTIGHKLMNSPKINSNPANFNQTPKEKAQSDLDQLKKLPCSSTPNVSVKGKMSLYKKLDCSDVVKSNMDKSLGMQFINTTHKVLGCVKRTSPDLSQSETNRNNRIQYFENEIIVRNGTKKSPLTPKEKSFHSPDVSEIKSQPLKYSGMLGVQKNLEAGFNLSTSYLDENISEPTHGTKPSLCHSSKILFDSSDDEKDIERSVVKSINGRKSMNGSNMFTITQLLEMASEKDNQLKQVKQNVLNDSITSHAKTISKNSDSNSISQCTSTKNKTHSSSVNDKSKHFNRKLDGLNIVDSEDECVFTIESSQSNDTSLIDSYMSTRHLAPTKSKLPQSSSVLEKLCFMEENKINVDPLELPKFNQSVLTCVNEIERDQSVQSSSDDDFDFFIPQRNAKKESSIKTLVKSPQLLSKVNSSQLNKKDSVVLKNLKKRNKLNLCELNVQEPAENSKDANHTKNVLDENEKVIEEKFVDNLHEINHKNNEKSVIKVKNSNTKHNSNSSENFSETLKLTFNKTDVSKTTSSSLKSHTTHFSNCSSSQYFKNTSNVPTSSCNDRNHVGTTNQSHTLSSQTTKTSSNEDQKWEQEFGGMTDLQFEKWLKSMNGNGTSSPKNTAVKSQVISQYFSSQSNSKNAQTMSMKSNNLFQTKSKTTSQSLKQPFSILKTNQATLIDSEQLSSGPKKCKTIIENVKKTEDEIFVLSSDDSDDFDFFKNNVEKNVSKTVSVHSKRFDNHIDRSNCEKKKKKCKQKRKTGNPYIEVEADVSVHEGEKVSSDDDLTNTSSDEMDSSFIDDENGYNETMGNYLKSVKSPARDVRKFKIPVLSDEVLNRNVYSQAVQPDRTDYLNDSFCVSDDESEDKDAREEKSLLEMAEMKLEMERKRKKKRSMEKKRRRRIIQVMFSSDEDG